MTRASQLSPPFPKPVPKGLVVPLNPPKLTVVIPVYNEKNSLLEIIRRVQSVPIEKEIILVDDFSTDGTRDVLRDLRERV